MVESLLQEAAGVIVNRLDLSWQEMTLDVGDEWSRRIASGSSRGSASTSCCATASRRHDARTGRFVKRELVRARNSGRDDAPWFN